MSEPRLLLASGSRYRLEMLSRLGLPVESVTPRLDERPREAERPERYVERLAIAKARFGDDWLRETDRTPRVTHVIGSDQTAWVDGVRFGKPGSFESARRQLLLASGRRVDFLTAVALLRAGQHSPAVETVATAAVFRTLTETEVERYLEREMPYDCAGGFKVEGLGISLFERIESPDPTALIGLPLIALAALLRQSGVPVP